MRTTRQLSLAVAALLALTLCASAFDGFITITNGYFVDSANGKPWVAHGIAYQTWNRPLGVWQTFQQIDYDLDEMKKMGANSIRVDFVWQHMEEQGDNIWSWTNYDYLVQAAEARGIRIFALVGYQWPPNWFPNEWYTMHPPGYDSGNIYHPTRWQSDIINYEHPSARAQYAEWFQNVCARYKDSKAIVGWIVGNEYGYLGLWSLKYDGYDPYCEQAFRDWCSAKYGTIATLNTAWGAAYTSFSQVVLSDEYAWTGPQGALWADMVQWHEDSIASFTAVGAAAARAADTNHLLSYSTVGMQWGEEDWRYHAEDRGKIARACASNNAALGFFSINNYPWAMDGSETRNGRWGVSYTKKTAGVPVVYSETGFTSSETLFPGMTLTRQGTLIRNTLWESLEAGSIGTHIFAWHDRPYITDREKGFGILYADRVIKPAFWTSRDTFTLMDQVDLGKYLMGSRDPKPMVAFLWDDATDSQYIRFENEMQHEAGALLRLGYEPNFLMGVNALASGEYTNYRAIILPRNMRVSDTVPGTTNSVLNFLLTQVIPKGIHVIAVADLPGMQDRWGKARAAFSNEVSQLFGIDASDVSGFQPAGAMSDSIYSDYYRKIRVRYTNAPGRLTNYVYSPSVWKYNDEIAVTNGGVLWAQMDTRNEGFEASNTNLDLWNKWGNGFITNWFPFDGTNMLGMSGDSGIWQDFPVAPFWPYTAGTRLRSNVDDPLRGGAYAMIAIEWMDKGGTNVGTNASARLMGDTTNGWARYQVDAVAPSNARTGRWLIRCGTMSNAPNLVVNGGLSGTNEAPDGWGSWNDGNHMAATWNYRSAPNSWGFWWGGGLAQSITNGFRPGDTVVFGGYLLNPSSDLLAGGKIGVIQLEFLTNSTYVVATNSAYPTINSTSASNTWILSQGTSTVPANVDMIRIVVRCNDSGSGWFFADDVYAFDATPGGPVYVDNKQWSPAVVAKDHGTAKAVSLLYSLDCLPDGSGDGQPDNLPYKWRYDILGGILEDYCGIAPAIRATGTNGYLCLPTYRTCTNGAVLMQVKNYLYDSSSSTGGAPQTFTIQCTQLVGKTIRAFEQCRVIETNSDGVFSLTLPPDGQEMLLAYNPPGGTNIFVQIANAPSVVHPYGDQSYGIYVKYDTGGKTGMILKVAFIENGDNGDGVTNEIYQVLSTNAVAGAGGNTFWLWIPDPNQSDTDYKSTPDGGNYIIKAWLEDASSNQLAQTIPQNVDLKWGISPLQQVPLNINKGDTTNMPVTWQDLDEQLYWQNTPLTRCAAFPNRVGIYRSTKTEAMYSNQFTRVNAVCDWLETLGYESANQMDVAFDNVTVMQPAGTNGVGGASIYADTVEAGTNGWAATGLWHLTADNPSSPTNCWAYNNGTNYSTGAATAGTLTSPWIGLTGTVVSATLRFRSWYETEDMGTAWDRKTVQVSTNGTTWTQIGQISGTNKQWTTVTVDLSAYLGKTVKVRFGFDSIDAMYNQYKGWQVDDVEVLAFSGSPVDLFLDPMEGTTNWTSDGLWRLATNRTTSSTNAWVYNDGADYDNGARNSGSIVSRWINLADASSASLTFRSWYKTEDNGTAYDRKLVYVSTNGTTWTRILQVSGPDSAWTTESYDLGAYAGQAIKLKFTFDTIDAINNAFEGWYLDDVRITTYSGPGTTLYTDNAEQGTNEWSAAGLWHQATDLCFSASTSWAYNNGVNYSTGGRNSGELVSRWIDLSGASSASLSFRSWYETEDTGLSWDRKVVYVTTNGSSWVQVRQVSGPNKQWTAQALDLSAYAGQRIRLKFFFDTIDGVYNGYAGWYVDDIQIKVIGSDFLFLDGFGAATIATNWTRVAGAANWETDSGTIRAWRIGNDDNILCAGDGTWSNVTVSADVRYNKQGPYFNDLELYARYQDRNNFIKVGIHNFYGFWRLKYTVRVATNNLTSGWIYEFSRTNQPAENTWYNLKIRAETNTFRVFLNGENVGSFTDTNFPRGKVAVGTKAIQLGIWEPARGYFFIDDDEYAYYSATEGSVVTLGKPLDLDWGYLVKFFPIVVLPGTYVMNDTEASNVVTWLTNGWFSLLATDGGVGMKNETGADDRGRLESLFGVSTSVTSLTSLAAITVGTNEHYATLDYKATDALPLVGSAHAWQPVGTALNLGAMDNGAATAPALICNVLTQKIDSPPKVFCFNYDVDLNGQLTNDCRLLAQRAFEWLESQTYKLTLELKWVVNPLDPNFDKVVFTTNFWTLNGWGTNSLNVQIPMDNVMTGTNLYWVMYTYPWDATNSWRTHKGFFSSGNDGNLWTTLGGFGLQLLGITDNTYGGRDWDMWVAYNTQGSNLLAHFGLKEQGKFVSEDNFRDGDFAGWTVDANGNTNIAWSVTNGALQAMIVDTGGYQFITRDALSVTGRNITIEYNARFMNGATNLGDGGLIYRGRVLYVNPKSCGWADTNATYFTNNVPATNRWNHVMVHIRDGAPFWNSDLYINSKPVFLGEPIEVTNWTSDTVGFLTPYAKGYQNWDNVRVVDEEYSMTTQAVAGYVSPTNANFWPSAPDYDPAMWEYDGTVAGGQYEWFIYFRGEGVHGYQGTKIYFSPRLMVEDTNFPVDMNWGETVQVPVEWEMLGSNQPARLTLNLQNPYTDKTWTTNTMMVTNSSGSAYITVTLPTNIPAAGDYQWAAYLSPTNAANAWLQRIGSDDTFRFDPMGLPVEPETIIWVHNSAPDLFTCYSDLGAPEGAQFFPWGSGINDGNYTNPVAPPEGIKSWRTVLSSTWAGWGTFFTNRIDFSAYNYIKFWLKSEEAIKIEVEAPQGTKKVAYLYQLPTWDMTKLGQWQEITIPITNFGFASPLTNVYGAASITMVLPDRYGTYFLNANTGWAVGSMYDAVYYRYVTDIRKTTNGGATWIMQRAGPPYAYDAANMDEVKFADASNGWMIGSGSTWILNSTNGGTSWAPQTNGVPSSSYWYDLDFINSKTGWACGYPGRVMKTTDGGTTWTNLATGTNSWLYGLDFTDESNGWACSLNTMLHTTNGGQTWIHQALAPSNYYMYDVIFVNSSTGWACGEGSTMTKTTDGGTTWTRATNLPAGTPTYLYNMSWPDASNGWVCSDSGFIGVTHDGGQTWTNSSSGVSASIQDVHFVNASTGFAVGAGGTLLKCINGTAARPTWSNAIPTATEFCVDNVRWTINP